MPNESIYDIRLYVHSIIIITAIIVINTIIIVVIHIRIHIYIYISMYGVCAHGAAIKKNKPQKHTVAGG